MKKLFLRSLSIIAALMIFVLGAGYAESGGWMSNWQRAAEDTPAPSFTRVPGTPADSYTGGYVAGASSYYYRNNYDVTPHCAIDGDTKTAWNSNRVSVGEWLEIDTAHGEEIIVEGFRFGNGYWKSKKVYNQNSRVKSVDVYCDGVYIESFDIEDVRGEYQTFMFYGPIQGSQFRFEIADAYRGGKYDDCCITEIELFGTATQSININGGGRIIGTVCQAADRAAAVSGARVEIYQGGALIDGVNSDGRGEYSFFSEPGDYLLKISADGYIPYEMYLTVMPNTTTYLETLLMVSGDPGMTGVASGRIINALTGEGLKDVTLTVRSGWGNGHGEVVMVINSGDNGAYSLGLPLGNYTLQMSKDGYVTNIVNIVVQQGETANQDGSITPYVEGNDFRIVITWGQDPRDLDSHVEGPLADGGTFHVCYYDKDAYDSGRHVCNLDVDDTDSYGPETVTLTTMDNGTYYYYVHHYAGNGTIATSSAQINVYQGAALLATFNVPGRGNDIYWNVFAIKNNEIIPRNTITAHPETDY